ncbi:MAG: phosphoenolpyruvate synthase [Clostridia bacterium]|nr:phosphoenolpyruvate synthase [Clostridia bacterium]
MRYILGFEVIGKQDVDIAGGKGANLGEMFQAGLQVPPGAVLTSGAYELFLRENHLDPGRMLEEGMQPSDIRGRMLEGSLPEAVEAELRQFYERLAGGTRLAVRSSATAEDLSDASFAGQQETFLNVAGEEQLQRSILACYASLWGDRAAAYRKARGYDSMSVRMAVVLQEMIESEKAGVMFTRSPAGGEDEVLINASWGLGEAVVSGLVTPDEYVCTRSGEIRRRTPGTKEVRVVYGDEGTRIEETPQALRSSDTLTEDEARELVAQGLRIEAYYGRPMDVEWAIRQGNIYLLQARAITTVEEKTPDLTGLPIPGPATGRMRENVLFNLEKVPRPYLPLDYSFGDAVGRQKETLLSEAGIEMGEMIRIDEEGISSFHARDSLRITRRIVHLPGILRKMLNGPFNEEISEKEITACRGLLEAMEKKSPEGPREIGKSLEEMLRLIERTAYARFRYAVFPQVLLNRRLERVLKKADPSASAFDLLEGLSYVTSDMNRDMAALSDSIRACEEERTLVMEESYATIVERSPRLRKAFQAFLETYGDWLDLNCYCFASRSWREDPDRFLHTLRTLLRSDAKKMERSGGERRFQELMQRVRSITREKQYRKFEDEVRYVRHDHVVREETQYLWERAFAQCRRLLRDAGQALHRSPEDLQYLFADELFSVLRAGHMTEEAEQKIRMRQDRRGVAEAYWAKSIASLLETGNAKGEQNRSIQGVQGSRGEAAGKACVIRGPEEFWKLEKGDILVCPLTDPEWTPLFTLAGGVVVDTGGTLSHAAIVAREYGIPAVLATGNATKLIRDGDRVLVSGDTGSVAIV